MIKAVATILVAATGLLGMKGALHAQTILVETPTLQISEGSEMMARRIVQVQPTAGSARLVAICHVNGDIRIGFAVDAGPGLGRQLPRIGTVSANGSERVFDAQVFKPDDRTILFFATPTNMRMKQRRPTEFILHIMQSRDFRAMLGFSGHDVEASFDGDLAALAALYVSSLCGFDPLD
ncbi:MAG: hypothetical protein F4213_02425 [Boseongicola sp. SB0677_bin_26]|nr:hypothetical protein [Boseongicola sp. SB0677_bin_26]